jgi:hypothetical protein
VVGATVDVPGDRVERSQDLPARGGVASLLVGGVAAALSSGLAWSSFLEQTQLLHSDRHRLLADIEVGG